MAKGVPILGKDPLGKAKYANVTESGDLRVQLSGTLTELEQAIVLLDAISGKDFATQTTLAAVLAKLADLESELATIKANQLSGDQKVQLSGTIVVKTVGDLPSTGYMAQVALVSEGRRVFIYDGNEWGEW